jgi:adenylate kinase
MNKKGLIVLSLVALTGFGFFYYYKYVQKKSAPQETSTVVAPKTILAFLGAPGSGKGTLAKQSVEKLHFKSLSTGDLIREEIASGGEKGKMLASYIHGGNLIPNDMMTDMVEGWLSKNAGQEPIILDGYPRTQEQAQTLVQLLKNKFADYTFGVVYLQITDEEEVVQRIANRLVCDKCKTVYSKLTLTDQQKLECQKCGGTLVQREDDKEEVVCSRLQIFNKNNNEIMAYYKSVNVPVHVVNVSHATPETIFENFKKELAAYAPKSAPGYESATTPEQQTAPAAVVSESVAPAAEQSAPAPQQ